MYLSTLALQNFRSYLKQEFNFSPAINIIVGPNTSGKTNILEAIFLLAIGKSFRAEKDIELVNFESDIGRVKGEIETGQNNVNKILQEIVLTKGSVAGQRSPIKKYLLNGVSKRQMDFIGVLRVVLFSPTDLELITNSPSLRRKYLDFVLVQVDREYRRALSSYEKGLRQRNKLLERIRDEGILKSQLSFWDGLLIRNGNIISAKREEYISFINNLNKTLGDFVVEYDKSEISRDRLLKYEKEEIAAATTLVGPHRDDFKLQMTNDKLQIKRDISLFGSRGEQRIAVLWLKIAELEYIAEKCKERPILLLDDIFSELDEEHRRHILEVIPKQQTIITTTDLNHVGKEFLGRVKVMELDIK